MLSNKILIAIDLGNTTFKLFFVDLSKNKNNIYSKFFDAKKQSINKIVSTINQYIKTKILKDDEFDYFISSVQPQFYALLLDELKIQQGQLFTVNDKIRNSIKTANNFQGIAETGEDLVLYIFYVQQMYNRSILFVSCGTATVIVGFNEKNELLGCNILPGLRLQYTSLINGTAQIKLYANRFFENTDNIPEYGTNTMEALKSGIIRGQAYIIDSFARGKEIILSGGYSKYIAPYLKVKNKVDNAILIKAIIFAYKYLKGESYEK